MIGLIAANATGFLRQAAIAHTFGAGRATDIYLVAFAVPEFIFIALPIILSAAFIPLFTEQRQRKNEKHAWFFGAQVTSALSILLILLTFLANLAAPLYVRWLAPGFTPSEHIQAVRLSRLMLPSISLMGIASLVGAALQVYQHFARPSFATAVYNLTFIFFLMGIPLVSSLERAGWGVTLGAMAALAIQVPLLWRHHPISVENHATEKRKKRTRIKIFSDLSYPSWTDNSKALSEFFQLAGWIAVGYATHHLILFIDRAMATALGAGRAAALNYAYHLALIIGQVSGLAVSTAIFPRLAEQIARGETSNARDSLANALRFVLLIGLPAAGGLIVLRIPIVRILFEHGAFDRASTIAVSIPLGWYVIAVLADAVCQPLWRVVYGLRNSRAVIAINGLQTGLRLVGNLALIPKFGYNGLALSAVLGLCIQALVLKWLVQYRIGSYLTRDWWYDVVRILFATFFMIGVMAGSMTLWPFNAEVSNFSTLIKIGSIGLIGSCTYISLLWSFGFKKLLIDQMMGEQPSRRL